MEVAKELSELEREILEIVLKEILEEQHQTHQLQEQILAAFTLLTKKLDVIENSLNTHNASIPSVDIIHIQQKIDLITSQIKLWMETLFKKVHSNNVRIFLESDAKKWAVILIVAITCLTYIYNLGVRWMETK